MQVQLRQPEIIQALKQYISFKGIDLANKTFDIHFTAGRKGTGLSADIDIQDCEIPGTEVGSEETVEPAAQAKVLTMVKPVVEAVEGTVGPNVDQPTPAKVTSSLFS